MDNLGLAKRMIAEHIAWQVRSGIKPLQKIRADMFKEIDHAFLEYVGEQGNTPEQRAHFLNMDAKKFTTIEIKLSQSKMRRYGHG
jgi:hypothetical protein